jgi:hypothetical protein
MANILGTVLGQTQTSVSRLPEIGALIPPAGGSSSCRPSRQRALCHGGLASPGSSPSVRRG